MNIDIKSVLSFIIINNIFIILLFSYFILNKKLRQWFLIYYLIGFLFQTLALGGIIFRQQILPEISIHGSHLLLMTGCALRTFSIISYDSKFRIKTFWVFVLAVLIFGGLILTFANNNYYLTLIQTIASVFFYGTGAIILLIRKEKYNFLYLLAITQLLFAVFQIFRLIAICKTGVDYDFYLSSQFDAKLYILISSLFLNIPNLGILFLMLEINTKTIAEKNKIIEDERQQLEIANQTKDKFFSIIAHDLRSPISSMTSMFEMINENYKEEVDDKLRKSLNALTTTSKQTFTLLENLLTWSRSQSGQIEYKPTTCNLEEVIENNLWLVQAIIQEKKIKIINQAGKNTSIVVDRAMLDTIIRNLLSNAIKYTRKDGTITISSKKSEQSVEISICDTGIGMNPDVLKRLFRIDLHNVSYPGTNREKGTGLGLILCQELITKLKGKIEVTSEKNKGSVFTITLPLSPIS
jgi:signal transduction histidine kinase